MFKTPHEAAYQVAKARYAELGVDSDAAMDALTRVAISVHCWQGDDVAGFEGGGSISDGGIMATGNYPGAARTPEELRQDLEKTYALLPGKHRLNLHAIYGEFGGKKVERNNIDFAHFKGWTDWARSNGIGMDFNPSYFAHPKASSGFTLAHSDAAIRQYWIEHGMACRKIAESIGRELNSPCVTNFWIPDGYKDIPADRLAPRERLMTSLDTIFADPVDRRWNLDAVECKLFGIGSESYVVGSHEFYLSYAIRNQLLLCLDAGHFHPTESIADKISSIMLFVDEILLHVSRGVRWDSDHAVILNDDTRATAEEIVRGDFLNRVHIGLDFFDASINRVAAWVIGTRAMQKALLLAMLEPIDTLRQLELDGDYTARLALLEECRTLPFGLVWDYCCERNGVPPESGWLREVRSYEKNVLSKRG
ncbi:MAG: L-rhamnose isomerase [Verrucomicrobia bacterium]|nr:L-rhamnose isomerase [Verrucomicrobiota bacterium]